MIVPNYFDSFKCIADKCRHSCCVGWEIDIDSDTEMFYSVLPGEFGGKIRQNISNTSPPHFILKNNKCPFLNEKGLCDIILTCGEDAVCEICREHPRFYNEYKNFTEAGLGLCCEEAARIVLNNKRFSLDGEYKKLNKTELNFVKERNEIFDILQNESLNISNRFEKLADKYGFSFLKLKDTCIIKSFLSLEILNDEWKNILKNSEKAQPEFEKHAYMFSQFACYLVYRHFKIEVEKTACIRFVLSSCFLIAKLLSVSGKSFENLVRMFSCEVEYSEKNIKDIIKRSGI